LSSVSETQGLLNTLWINLILFAFLMTFFEVNRHMRSTYLKRVTKRFQRCNRVPPPPSTFPFAWVLTVMDVEEEDFLRMVGLDGYMLMRYINVCFRMSVFFTIWGLVALVPVYGNAPGKHIAWNKYTLANIPNDPKADQLWVPAVFAYVFSIYFCHLMYTEYKNFVKKRVQYLIQGDPDTPPQTYYTVMVEKVPISLRSAPALEAFFEKLFPGGVYSVEVALDLSELDALTLERRLVRNALEKSIALYKASGKRPTQWIRKDFYKDSQELALMPAENNAMARFFGCIVVDAIAHLTRVLVTLNEGVRLLQIATFQQRQKIDEEETERQQNIRGKIEVHATQVASHVAGRLRDQTAKVSSMFATANSGGRTMVASASTGGLTSHTSTVDAFLGLATTDSTGMTQLNTDRDRDSVTFDDGYTLESKRSPLLLGDSLQPMRAADPAPDTIVQMSSPFTVPVRSFGEGGEGTSYTVEMKTTNGGSTHTSAKGSAKGSEKGSEKTNHTEADFNIGMGRKMLSLGVRIVGGSVGGLAKEGYKTASIATKGALRGVLEGIRAVELLTVGAYYKTSSTAFVTLKSRVAECSSHQMFLSHLHYSMHVKSAPNPKDCIWENISIPPKQIAMRRTIADFTLIVGAVFWSIVVGFITAIANLESLSKELPFLQAYRNTIVYDVMNNYLAVALLPILRRAQARKRNPELHHDAVFLLPTGQRVRIGRARIDRQQPPPDHRESVQHPQHPRHVPPVPLDVLHQPPHRQDLHRRTPRDAPRLAPHRNPLRAHVSGQEEMHHPRAQNGRLRQPAHPVRMDLPQPADGADDHLYLLLHRPAAGPLRHALLRLLLRHVQVPAALRVHQRLPVGGVHVVRRVQSIHAGPDLRCPHPPRLPGHPGDFL
jgi:hypothetical protein